MSFNYDERTGLLTIDGMSIYKDIECPIVCNLFLCGDTTLKLIDM